MKYLIYINIFMILVQSSNNLFGQSDISGVGSGHQGSTNSLYYVGWDASTTFDLDIKHMATSTPRNINFFTNATQWMNLSTTGNLGLSNSWPFTPLSLVHLNRSTAISVSARFTNSNSTNGALFGIDAAGNAQINQLDALSINFLTNNTQRMTIRGANNSPYVGLSNVGYIGIATTAPGSPLTIEADGSPTGQIIPGSNWSNGIMIRNNGTLIFEGDRGSVPANRDFFMAHPSINFSIKIPIFQLQQREV